MQVENELPQPALRMLAAGWFGNRIGSKPIDGVATGEQVWAYDLVASKWRGCVVLQIFKRHYDGHSTFVTVAGETIESTLLHPYWVVSGDDLANRPRRDHLPQVPEGATTPGRWVDAGDLRVADVLLLMDGRMMPVEAVRTSPYHALVYNFAVAELECYAVGHGSVLVHNQNGAELAGGFRFSTTVANHATDVITSGEKAGQLARPYMSSPGTSALVREIMAGRKPIADPGGVPGALRWDVAGSFRGTAGVWELVVAQDKTILHFLFSRGLP